MERRAKFAFACFLTAVGIPMIFAGEEFLGQHDRPVAKKPRSFAKCRYEKLLVLRHRIRYVYLVYSSKARASFLRAGAR